MSDLGLQMVAKRDPKAYQNRTKNQSKIMQKTKRKKHLCKIVLAPFVDDLGLFCDRSWGHFYGFYNCF